MRVTFDAYWLISGPPSGRNVVDAILRTWSAEYPEDRIIAVVPSKDEREARSRYASTLKNVDFKRTRIPNHALHNAFFFAQNADVVVTQNFAPLRRRPNQVGITFIHDLMFLDHPEWFTRKERVYLGLIPILSRKANVLATSSVAESLRISRLLNRHDVLPVGLAVPLDRETPRAAPAERDQFILAVGRLNVRKNISRLIRALKNSNLISPSFPLKIVGQVDGLQEEVSADDASVHWLGHVSDAELNQLFRSARLFVFPSLDEGFGLPIAEAMNAGTPMAVSDIPAFREFDSGAVFFDPLNETSIAEAVREAMHSDRKPPEFKESWSDVVRQLRSAGRR